jgi:hypothetical protein
MNRVVGAEQVRLDDRAVAVRREVVHAAEVADPGVVDEDVEPAEPFLRPFDKRLLVLLASSVRAEPVDLASAGREVPTPCERFSRLFRRSRT